MDCSCLWLASISFQASSKCVWAVVTRRWFFAKRVACRRERGFRHGHGAWPVLSRLLLSINGLAVGGWGHELGLDHRAVDCGRSRKNAAGWRTVGVGLWAWADCRKSAQVDESRALVVWSRNEVTRISLE